MRNGGTESSTRSVSDVSRTSGRPPISDNVENTDSVGVTVVLTAAELKRTVWVERRGGFVEVGRARSALGGNVCANSLTRSIALSSRLSLEMNRVNDEED